MRRGDVLARLDNGAQRDRAGLGAGQPRRLAGQPGRHPRRAHRHRGRRAGPPGRPGQRRHRRRSPRPGRRAQPVARQPVRPASLAGPGAGHGRGGRPARLRAAPGPGAVAGRSAARSLRALPRARRSRIARSSTQQLDRLRDAQNQTPPDVMRDQRRQLPHRGPDQQDRGPGGRRAGRARRTSTPRSANVRVLRAGGRSQPHLAARGPPPPGRRLRHPAQRHRRRPPPGRHRPHPAGRQPGPAAAHRCARNRIEAAGQGRRRGGGDRHRRAGPVADAPTPAARWRTPSCAPPPTVSWDRRSQGGRGWPPAARNARPGLGCRRTAPGRRRLAVGDPGAGGPRRCPQGAGPGAAARPGPDHPVPDPRAAGQGHVQRVRRRQPHTGDSARVTVDAFPGRVLAARVASIDPIEAVQRERRDLRGHAGAGRTTAAACAPA